MARLVRYYLVVRGSIVYREYLHALEPPTWAHSPFTPLKFPTREAAQEIADKYPGTARVIGRTA